MTRPFGRALPALLILLAALGFLVFSLPASAKTLVFCSEGNPESLNPQVVVTASGMNATGPIFDTLLRFKAGGAEIEPGLAESWSVSADGTDYTFHLRKGVKFHSNAGFTPTRDLDADDVIFSLERQWKADNPFHAGASFDYFSDMGMGDLLKSVEKVDDLTIRIRLAKVEAPFLADLTMPFTSILSAEYAAAMMKAGTPGKLDAEPIGTGPFAFEMYRPDVAIHYRGFEGYWRGRPPVDTLVFAITPNESVRLNKLRSGECQLMAFPDPNDAARIEADPMLKLMRQESLNIGYLSMNTTRPPFDDVRVRRAVNLAIDKAALVEAVYGRGGTPAKTVIPPTMWSFNDAVRDYAYDVAAASALMREAGKARGVEVELWYIPVARSYNPDAKRMAEMIADDLSRIGIRVKLVTTEWTAYRGAMREGVAPMALYGWTSDNGDPDNFFGLLLACPDRVPTSNNVSKWCDARYDALIERAKRESDQGRREALYREAQVIVHEAAPWVPIAHTVAYMALRRDVVGFTMDAFGTYRFDAADIAP